jgi:hypothetical protein
MASAQLRGLPDRARGVYTGKAGDAPNPPGCLHTAASTRKLDDRRSMMMPLSMTLEPVLPHLPPSLRNGHGGRSQQLNGGVALRSKLNLRQSTRNQPPALFLWLGLPTDPIPHQTHTCSRRTNLRSPCLPKATAASPSPSSPISVALRDKQTRRRHTHDRHMNPTRSNPTKHPIYDAVVQCAAKSSARPEQPAAGSVY